jgi:molecular chaperone DnaK (HSP70)
MSEISRFNSEQDIEKISVRSRFDSELDIEKISLLKSVLLSVEQDVEFAKHLQLKGVSTSIDHWMHSQTFLDEVGVLFPSQASIEENILNPSDRAVASYILRKMQTIKSLCLELSIPYPTKFIQRSCDQTLESFMLNHFGEEVISEMKSIVHVMGIDIGGSNVSVSICEDGSVPTICVTKEFTSVGMSYISILSMAREIAENLLGHNVWEVFVSVPMNSSIASRIAIRQAAHESGMRVVGTSNSPQLACAMYSVVTRQSTERHVVVCDVGSVSVDTAVFNIDDNFIETKAVTFCTQLAGDEFTNRLVEYFKKAITEQFGTALCDDPVSLTQLRALCEEVKATLSVSHSAHLAIDSLDETICFKATISREQFEELCVDLLDGLQKELRALLAGAGVEAVDEALLIGGSSAIPMVRRAFFSAMRNADASLDTHALSLPHPEPASEQTSMNFDDSGMSGCWGAAVMAAVRARVLPAASPYSDFLLVDVLTHDICMELSEGMLHVIAARNAAIPCQRTAVFTTTFDNQRAALVHLLESAGEDQASKKGPHASSIGWFLLHDIPPMPEGVPKIVVTVEVNVDYKVIVRAEETTSGTRHGLVVSMDTSPNVPEYFNKEMLMMKPSNTHMQLVSS